MRERIIDFLNIKYPSFTIELLRVEERYTKSRGLEYWVYFEKGNQVTKEVLTEHQYNML